MAARSPAPSAPSTTATPSTQLINDRREIFGWSMYRFANTAFSTTVAVVFLGPYLAALVDGAAKARPGGVARLLGLPIAPDSFLSYCIAFSVVFQAGFLPILGAIADYSHRRKQLMRLFANIGAIATVGLFFVQGDLWWLGGALFIIANLAYGASVVFLNAYLPDIASASQRDRVSAFGWGIGYLGGGLLLIGNLVLFLLHDKLGVPSGLAVRINLASAGVWWFVWSIWTWVTLRTRQPARQMPPGQSIWAVAFNQLSETMETPARVIAGLLLSPLLVVILLPLVSLLGLPIEGVFLALLGPIIMIVRFLWRKSRTIPETAKYLAAYLIYNDGIQTVISVAAVFAAAPLARGGLAIATVPLTLIILMIQFVGFGGTLFFGWLAGKLGTKQALILSLVIWAGVVIYAYFGMRDRAVMPGLGIPRAEFEFWVLSAFIATVLGGSQALSRSLFAQMVPKGQEAEFFSIYEISESGTSWLGPLIFGVVNQAIGNLRPAILSVIVFFAVGLVILPFVNTKRAHAESGQTDLGPQPLAT